MSSLRKRFDAQVVVPCELAMKTAVRNLAAEYDLSDAEVARLCIESALPHVRTQLATERERRNTNLAVPDPDRLAAAS